MQKQNLTCADARHYIHLAVGEDIAADEEARLAEHLHDCAECRAYNASMLDSMSVLSQVRDQEVEIPRGSLWPAMADQLKVRQAKAVETQEGKRFNFAVVALCVCSLMLAIVTAVQNLPTQSPGFAEYSSMPVSGMNVNYPSQPQAMPGQVGQLIEVEGPGGVRYLVDPVSRQLFVPRAPSTPTSSFKSNNDLSF